MEHQLEIAEDGSLIAITASGNAQPQGFVDYISELKVLLRKTSISKIIADYRNLNFEGTDADDVTPVNEKVKDVTPWLNDRKIATIVNGEIAEAFGAIWDPAMTTAQSFEHQLFTSLEDARQWLGA